MSGPGYPHSPRRLRAWAQPRALGGTMGSVASGTWSKPRSGAPGTPVAAHGPRFPPGRRAGGPGFVVTAEPAAAHDRLVGPSRQLPPQDTPLARRLEELAHRAWPPLRQDAWEGWVLRESAGSSRRGNSVWARGGVSDLPTALAAVRAFYATAGLPPTFQITPVSMPAALHGALDAAGFDDAGPTDVCVAGIDGIRTALATVDEPSTRVASDTASRPLIEVVVLDVPDDRWLAMAGRVLSTFGPQRDGTLAVLTTVTLPQRYVTVLADGKPVGVGRGTLDGGTLDDGWLGVYSMATLPGARGRGVARRSLAALVDWAATNGVSHAYLQVEESSRAARALYASLGFRPVYRYSYRRPRRRPGAAAIPAPGGRGCSGGRG